MKLKKVVSAIVLCTIFSSIITGCGSSSAATSSGDSEASEDSGSELIVSWWGNQARNEGTQLVIDKYMEENPDVTIDGQFSEWSDYWNKLATSSAGHMLPDVVQMDYKYLEQYVSNDLLVDLTPYVESGELDLSNADESVIESGEIDGGLYAIPLGINAPALMYNKTLLDENGIEIKDNMNMTEFIDLCREIYDKTGYKTDIAYGNGDIFIEYMMRSMGSVLYEPDSLGATQDQLEQFFDLYELGISEGWMCPPEIYTERTIGTPEQMPLVYGSSPSNMSWCAFTYSNALTSLQNSAPDGVEISMTTWPADDLEKADYLRPSMFFSVTADSKNPEEAVKFINYWTNNVDANEILLAERGVPLSTTISDTIIGEMDEDSQKIFSYVNDVVAQNCSAINPPAPSGSAEVSVLVDQLVEKVCYGQLTAQEAAEQLYEQGNNILGK